MRHTSACDESFKNYEKELQQFNEQYPNYCRICFATGITHWTENQAPFGSGESWLMDMEDICETCLGKSKCPRCGEETMQADDADVIPNKCSKCGWTQEVAGWPIVPECDCWEKDCEEFEKMV